MRTSLFLLLGANDSVPISTVSSDNNIRARRGGDDTYGSWDWFINQIKEDNVEAKPTETIPKTQPKRATSHTGRRTGSHAALPATSGISSGRVRSQRFIPSNQPLGAHGSKDDDRFNWFGKKKEAPVMLSARSGLPSASFVNKQFIGSTTDNAALVYNSVADYGGSGDDGATVTSFRPESGPSFYEYYDENSAEAGASRGSFDYAYADTSDHEAGKSGSSFTFNTQVQNTHFNPWSEYTQSRIEDGQLLPVAMVNEWPSNTHTLGGAIFEVMNFVFGATGTCYINLPQSVYWFHAFNAHIDPSASDPSAGVYAIVAANQAFEGISTLDFIVNYQSDDMRFDASSIELSCDSTDTWETSLYSFPGNTVGDVGRTNIRRPNDGWGFHGKKLIVEFPYNVSEFYTDDSRLTVTTDGENNTSGKRFTIQGLSGTYLEEVWFGWNYNEASWFTAADTSVSIFDDEDANVTINV